MSKSTLHYALCLVFSLLSTGLKAQIKASFTTSADSGCTTISESFVNTSTGLKSPYTITWNFGDGKTATGTSATHTYAAGTYKVALHMKDATGSVDSAFKTIVIFATPKPNLGPALRGCWGHTLMLSTGIGHMPYVSWTHILGSDTSKNFLKGDTIYIADSGIYIVNVQDSAGCSGTDTVQVFLNPLVKANNASYHVCLGDSITLNAGIYGSGSSIIWYDPIHNKLLSTGPAYSIISVAYQTMVEVVISQSLHGVTCVDTGIITVYAEQPIEVKLPKIPPICVNAPAFLLDYLVKGSYAGGNWYYPANPAAVVNGYLYPAIMGVTGSSTNQGYLHYLYKSQYGCVSDDSTLIDISGLPPVNAGPDTAICNNSGKYLLSSTRVSPPGGAWYPLMFAGNLYPGILSTPAAAVVYSPGGDSIFFDPYASGVLDTVYGVVYSYKSPGPGQCANSDTVFIKVSRPRDARWTMNYTGKDPLFHALDSGMNNTSYLWNFGDGTTANGHGVKHTYSKKGTYKVSLEVISGGCQTFYDSTVTINSSSGIRQSFDNQDFNLNIYPNPFTSNENISYQLNRKTDVLLQIYDLTGREIATILNETESEGQHYIKMNADQYHLKPCMYLLKFSTVDGNITRRIVKW